MIGFRIIWGVILAGVIGYNFRRAWKLEHGMPNYRTNSIGKDFGTETYVLVPPTVLFWILMLFLVMYMFKAGPKEGIILFITLTAEVLIALSIYYVMMLVFLPFLRKRISARACALLWLVPTFLCWQAHILISLMPLPRLTVLIPRSILPVIAIVWLAGFLIIGGYFFASHLIFCAEVKETAAEETNGEILAIWERELEALDYKRPVRLLRADVPAPFSMGRTKRSRCTVLPRHDYTSSELSMIFRHELHHLQRSDVDTKVFLCLCNALCWFNPLVWIATKKGAQDLERSCDEIVTEGMDAAERKAYANLLLDTAAPARGCTTCLSAAAGTLRYRLKSVIEPRKRMLGTVLLMFSLFICVMCFGLISVSDAKGNFSSLVLNGDTTIREIYDSRTDDTAKGGDPDRLIEALDELTFEHIAGEREFRSIDDRKLSFWMSNGEYATITGQYLYIHEFRFPTKADDCYLIKDPVDLDALIAKMY